MNSAPTILMAPSTAKAGEEFYDYSVSLSDAYLRAVMEAGGVDNSRAKLSGATVLRVENGQRVSRRVNLKDALEGKDASLFYLKPFDIIYVPAKAINF